MNKKDLDELANHCFGKKHYASLSTLRVPNNAGPHHLILKKREIKSQSILTPPKVTDENSPFKEFDEFVAAEISEW